VGLTIQNTKVYQWLTNKPLGTRNATTSRGRSWFGHRGKNPIGNPVPIYDLSQDSYILAYLLASPLCTRSTIPNITKVYDAIRRPAAKRVTELSRLAGRHCQINTPEFEDVTEGATVELDRLKTLVNTISKNWEWSWNESAEDDKRRALEMLAVQVHQESATLVTIPKNHHRSVATSLFNRLGFLLGVAALAFAYFSVNPTFLINVRHFSEYR